MKTFIEIFDRKYSSLHARSVEIIQNTPAESLYRQPRERNALFPNGSVGESILRSAGAVEQTFGGITSRLWDDPFEWTLPEELSTPNAVLNYLEEAEAVRQKGFAFFNSDDDLRREIAAPEKIITLFELLVDTLARAERFQGCAAAILEIFAERRLSR